MKNLFKHILQIIRHPVIFFEEAQTWEKRPMWIPVLILVLTGIIGGLSAGGAVSAFSGMLTEDQAGMIKTIAIITGIIGGPIGLLLAWLIKGLIYQGILKKMSGDGDEAKLNDTLFFTGIASFPLMIPAILNTIIALTGHVSLNLSGGFNVVSYLAGSINLFIIYQLFLTIIAMAKLHRLSYKKAAIPIIALEVIVAIFNLVTGLMSASSTASVMNSVNSGQ